VRAAGYFRYKKLYTLLSKYKVIIMKISMLKKSNRNESSKRWFLGTGINVLLHQGYKWMNKSCNEEIAPVYQQENVVIIPWKQMIKLLFPAEEINEDQKGGSS